MSDILMEKYDELIETGEFDEFIENDVKKVVKDSYGGDNTLSGWTYHIILGENGLKIVGPLSQGTVTEGSYKGTELILTKINTYKELDMNLQWEDILNLGDTIEERHRNELKLLNEIIYETEIENLKNELEESNQDFSLIHCLNNSSTYLYVENAFKNLFPEAWNECVHNYLEFAWDYDKDLILNDIEHSIVVYKQCVAMQ